MPKIKPNQFEQERANIRAEITAAMIKAGHDKKSLSEKNGDSIQYTLRAHEQPRSNDIIRTSEDTKGDRPNSDDRGAIDCLLSAERNNAKQKGRRGRGQYVII